MRGIPTQPVGYSGLSGSGFASPIARRVDMPGGSSKVASYVADLYDVAKAHRTTIDRYWDDYYKYFCGQQWKYPNYLRSRDGWKAQLVVNHVLKNIEHEVAILLDGAPKIGVQATMPSQAPYAATLQIGLDSIWRRRKFLQRLEDALKSALIYGTGYLKVYWNPVLENGQGDVDIEHVPTECIYVDPQAKDFDETCQYVIERKPVTMAHVKQFWPEKAHLVHGDSSKDGSYQEQKQMGRTLTNMSDPVAPLLWMSPVGDNPTVADQTDYSSPPYRPATRSRQQWVSLIECWVRDPAKHKVGEWRSVGVDPQSGLPTVQWVEREVAKYPYGRLIHVAGGVVLDDSPVETSMWPYVRIVDISKPSEFYGMGEVELVKDLQFEHNRRRSQMVDYATQMGNPIWIYDNNSGVKQEMLSNRPNLCIPKQPGSEVRREAPIPMPNWMPSLTQQAAHEMDAIMGVADAAQGVPRSARSGSAVTAAQNANTQRIRSKSRNMAGALEQAGRIMIGLMQRYYTTPRFIRMTGDANQTYWIPFDGRFIRGDWDLSVEPDSMAPNSKAQRHEMWMRLYGMQAVDRRALLEGLEVPGAQDILRRMGDLGAWQPVQYPGYPGPPARDRADASGMSTAVRVQPPPPMAPAGPPPGYGQNRQGSPQQPAGFGGQPNPAPAGRGGGGFGKR